MTLNKSCYKILENYQETIKFILIIVIFIEYGGRFQNIIGQLISN